MRVLRKSFAEIEARERKEIDKFIEDNCGLVFHEIEFNRIVSESFNTELFYLIALDNKSQIVGICPMHTIKEGFLKVTYSNPAIFEVPYGGWVFDERRVSIRQLLKKTRLSFLESLVYWSNTEIQHSIYKNLQFEKKTIWFRQYSKRECRTAIIDLKQTEDEIIYNSISRNTRHNIKRAAKKGVTIEELGPDNFNIFVRIVDTFKKKLGLKKVESGFYSNIFRYYYERNKIKLFAAKHENEYISAVLNIGNKNITHAWIAGRINNIKKNLYQNELLWWESIKWAKKNGSRYFDLCVIEKERLPHIAIFKLGFSKNLVPFYYITKKTLTFKILKRIKKWF